MNESGTNNKVPGKKSDHEQPHLSPRYEDKRGKNMESTGFSEVKQYFGSNNLSSLHLKNHEASIESDRAPTNDDRGQNNMGIPFNNNDLDPGSPRRDQNSNIQTPSIKTPDKLSGSAKDHIVLMSFMDKSATNSLSPHINANSKPARSYRLSPRQVQTSEEIPMSSSKLVKKNEQTNKSFSRLITKAIGGFLSARKPKGTEKKKSTYLSEQGFRIMNDVAYYPDNESDMNLKNARGIDPKMRTGDQLWDKLKVKMKGGKFKTMRKMLTWFESRKNPHDRVRRTNIMQYLQDRWYNYSLKLRKVTNVVLPDGEVSLYWDLLVGVFLIAQLFFIPLFICFGSFSQHWTALLIFIEVFFVLDMGMVLNTGYYQNGILVINRRRIVRKYLLSFKFLWDFLSAFPYLLVIVLTDSDYQTEYVNNRNPMNYHSYFSDATDLSQILFIMQGFHMLKFTRLRRIFKKLEERMQLSDSATGFLGVLKLVLGIFFIAHVCASVFHLIALESSLSIEPYQPGYLQNTWLRDIQLDEAPNFSRYIAALYWSTATMVTVGYGDIAPKNDWERIFTMITMYIASVVFGYMMNTISSVFRRFEKSKSVYNERIDMINRYMTHRGVQKDFQVRIRKYLEFIWDLDNTIKEEENSFVNALSKPIRDELLIQVNGKVLESCPFIFHNFSKRFVQSLCSIMIERTFSPDEIIIDEDENSSDQYLYLITKGEVEMQLKHQGATLRKLGSGRSFGEISFITGSKSSASARSFFFSTVFMIRRQDFMDKLKEFPVDREKFCQLRDSMVLYRDFSILKMKCFICEDDSHIARDCPKSHYCVDPLSLGKFFLQCENKFRRCFQREENKFPKRTNCLSKFNFINQTIENVKSRWKAEGHLEDGPSDQEGENEEQDQVQLPPKLADEVVVLPLETREMSSNNVTLHMDSGGNLAALRQGSRLEKIRNKNKSILLNVPDRSPYKKKSDAFGYESPELKPRKGTIQANVFMRKRLQSDAYQLSRPRPTIEIPQSPGLKAKIFSIENMAENLGGLAHSDSYSKFAPNLARKFIPSIVQGQNEKKIINNKIIEFESNEREQNASGMGDPDGHPQEMETDFDAIANYEIYFPHNNFANIINKRTNPFASPTRPKKQARKAKVHTMHQPERPRSLLSMNRSQSNKRKLQLEDASPFQVQGRLESSEESQRTFAIAYEDFEFAKNLVDRKDSFQPSSSMKKPKKLSPQQPPANLNENTKILEHKSTLSKVFVKVDRPMTTEGYDETKGPKPPH